MLDIISLPSIPKLIKICQSIATLDAIIMPEWEFRYYSFNKNWGKDEMMASMRNGSGDHYFILFNHYGSIIKGYNQTCFMAEKIKQDKNFYLDIFKEVPKEFRTFVKEPAFIIPESTFCIWRRYQDFEWKSGIPISLQREDFGGVRDLLSILEGNVKTYRIWAESYYEREISEEAIAKIYDHAPLTQKLLECINSENNLKTLEKDIEEIGYPMKLGS